MAPALRQSNHVRVTNENRLVLVAADMFQTRAIRYRVAQAHCSHTLYPDQRNFMSTSQNSVTLN